MRRIELPCYGIKIEITDQYGGTITSDLKEELPSWKDPRSDDEGAKQFNAAIDGIEAMILAHACCGVSVNSECYLAGIRAAVEAIGNNF